jgi:predicted phage terminase large subunit-like protein
VSFASALAAQLVPVRKWATPGAMAKALDPATVQTPALDLIDRELVKLTDMVQAGRVVHDLHVYLPPQEGKALALDTPVATPSGWTTMGALAVGDEVFDQDGRPCRVTWTSPTWTDRPCYTVRTGDGEAIVADVEHEWVVRLTRESGQHLHTTKVLAKQRVKNAQILGPAGLGLPDADLPLDPYVLGAWLGDGNSADAIFTCADPEIVDRIRAAGIPCRRLNSAPYRWSLAPEGGSSRISPVRAALRDLEVLRNKHIPGVYMRGSTAQRLALLQGLVDTDGYVSPKGLVEYTSTCERLARDVAELVFTLGAKAYVGTGRATVNGRDCGPKWRVKFMLAGAAHLPRKAVRCKDSTVARTRYVWAEPCPSVPTRCIEVDSPSHTYLAGRTLLPTHNSQRVSRRWPEWMLSSDPTLRIGIVSYGDELATSWGRQIRRDALAHPDLGIQLREDSRAAGRWETPQGGMVYCTGIAGGLAGVPLDVLIFDDPVKNREEAESGSIQRRNFDFYENVGVPRLSPRGVIVVMTTRWNKKDLAGQVLEAKVRPQKVISIPAVAEDNDPLGRRPGQELISSRKREPGYFLGLQERMSPYAFRSIYQQRPTDPTGSIFMRDRWRYWTWQSWPDHLDLSGVTLDLRDTWRFITADLAASTRTSADYTVAAAWALTLNRDLVCLGRVRARSPQEGHWDLIRPLAVEWRTVDVGVESTMMGTTLVRAATRAGLSPFDLHADRDKVTRAIPYSHMQRQGQVWLPASADWLDEWVGEHADFPTGVHDDQVDVGAYAARQAIGGWHPGGSPATPAEQRPDPFESQLSSALGRADGLGYL